MFYIAHYIYFLLCTCGKCSCIHFYSILLWIINDFKNFQALNVFWLSSSIYGLMQSFLIQSPRLKRIARVPITESELEHPYQYFFSRLKSKLHLTNK